jgi:hypothetical protein
MEAPVAESGREGQEVSRRIREELERIRDAEGRVEDALESVRQARRRVEVIARDLGREEMRVRALVREELRAANGAAGTQPPLADAEPDTEAARPWRTDAAAGWSRRPVAPEVDALPVPAALPEPIRVDAPVLPPAPAVGAPDVPLPAAVPASAWVFPPHRLVAIGVAAFVVVMLVGWLALRGLQRETVAGAEDASTLDRNAPTPAPSAPVGVAAPAPTPAPLPPTVVQAAALAAIPADPAARAALYDSLWAARSPLFDPLLAAVERDSDDDAIERALEAWRADGVDVQEGDLLHSAFVQAALNLRMGRDLDVDGQLLRNPCRGSSCTALLDLWRVQRERYGLPEPPPDAATNTTALRLAEVALVLDWMRESAGG